MVGAVASSTSFRNANLRKVAWKEGEVFGCNFTGASLVEADMSSSLLEGSTFAGADVSSANFMKSDLSGADFRGALGLKKARFEQAMGAPQPLGLPASVDIAPP